MIYSIQQIRAFAAILVVMTHVNGALSPIPNAVFVPSFEEVNIAFTFAAGFLFHHLSLNEPFGNFMRRRAFNVLIPYALISIPAILLYTVGNKAHPHVDLSQIPDALVPVYLLLTGLQLGPLWFIPMIFTVYAMTPLLRQVDRAGWLYAVAIGGTLILGTFLFVRPEANANPIQAALHYIPVFLIGMACSRYNERISAFCQNALVWGPALLLFLALIYVTSRIDGQWQYPLKVTMLICMFIVTCRTARYRSRLIDILAAYSFGIFFLHGYFASVMRMLSARGTFEWEATGFNLLLLTALVCALCCAVIYGVKLVFGKRSRLLVGA